HSVPKLSDFESELSHWFKNQTSIAP
nr:Chain G, Spike protein S2' [Human coronavirus HKU1 (isolate N1)]8DGW_I Chain I, Spike protein S2' [Human coronavirus HKU1 (isolate N1)]8DGW_J Chain J, Spike protein S2' [Human coronavirus HKU1 (isolate N1)]8DGW_K Chain K, Spike protein S2' [Human coronavirus HKU1 (isolate N1)]